MRITVFCGSSRRSAEPYLEAARVLGTKLARRGHVLVYGGAKIGLMGAVADAALRGGGAVRGVILQDFVDRGDVHHPGIEMESVDDMRARKAGLDGNGDAFITLAGGLGTLEEFAEMLSFRQLGFHHRPLVLLNTAGFFDPLLEWIDGAVDAGFVRAEHRDMLAVTDDPHRAVTLCEQGAGTEAPSKFRG